MFSEILVSIVIPHYNTNKNLLFRLLDSIPNRRDIEIIIIDDNSNPNHVNKEELKNIENIDSRVKVFLLEEGKGPGAVRNIGIKSAVGEWILFSDSDDFFNKSNLECLLQLLKKQDFQVIWYGFGTELYGFEKKSNTIIPINDNDKWAFVKTLAPWNKIMRREFLIKNEILFGNEYYCEDQIFSIRLIGESCNVALFSDEVYSYECNEGSLSKTSDYNRLINGLKIEFESNRLLRKYGKLSVECRNPLIGGLLFRIYQKSKFAYIYYLLKELFIFGQEITKADFVVTSNLRNVRPSMSQQLFDPIKVFLGRFKKYNV